MKLLTAASAFFVILATSFSWSQSFPGCPTVDAGPDQLLNCSTPCVTLNANPFDAGATTSYTAGAIPATPPIPYNQAGGNPISVGIDDVWSPVINLPFDFCFYGQTYNSCVVGSNGTISFNTAYANGFQNWSFTASCPSAALVDRGNIFGPYHDIDPSIGGSVNWYLLGTAPCRIFVVSFNQIPLYSCTSLSTTHMIVLYETTNAIDVYINNKPTCTSWNSGNTVVGVQNMNGTQGIAAPGRNTGPWTVNTPEAWRFTPSGAPIYTVDWLENGAVIGTGNTIDVCPVVSTDYIAQVTYTACNGTVIVETDTVNVAPSPGTVTVNEISNTPTGCGTPTGSVTVGGSGGAPGYTYSFDDTLNFQSSNVFNGLAAGTYTVYAQDQNGCIGGVVVTIGTPPLPDLTGVDTVNTTCGLLNGEIEVMGSGGTSPYSYSIGTGPGQASGLFTGLDVGTYTLYVTDVNNCTDSVEISIGADPFPVISFVETDTICSNASNGSVEVTANMGALPYTYNVDGGSSQSSGVFNGLTAGVHTFQVTDNAGCTDEIDLEVYQHPDPSIFADTFACNFGMYVSGTTSYMGGTWSSSDTAVHFSPSEIVDNPHIWTYGEDGLFTVVFTDSICNIAVTAVIDFYEYPSTWLEDTSLCIGETFTVTAPNDNPHTTLYEWSNGALGETLVTNASGTYILTMTNTCHTNQDTISVEFKLCDINVPNILSLAEGSQNSLWYVQAQGLSEFEIFITNRWGNVVYECNDPHASCYWDGRSKNGVFVEEGTYFYNIKAKDENDNEINKHGFIQVVD